MKKFELPYNFEDDFIDELLSLDKKYFDYIKFIYLPAFKEGNILNTREFEPLMNNPNYINIDKYNEILRKLKTFNIDLALLVQNGATLEIIEKYYNEFNIKYFIINDDDLAKEIKSKYGNKIYLILSVTRVLKYNDLISKDLSMYDEIVLYFWFNRHLDYIKKLPLKYKYSIMVNLFCSCNCKYARAHWFLNKDVCFKNKDNYHSVNIPSNDLIYFDKYVNSFKICDRMESSDYIFNSLKEYVDSYCNLDNTKYNKDRESRYNVKD